MHTESTDRESIPEWPNRLGIEGIEFIEYATSRPQALGQVLEQALGQALDVSFDSKMPVINAQWSQRRHCHDQFCFDCQKCSHCYHGALTPTLSSASRAATAILAC
jgi:hypothetical protein